MFKTVMLSVMIFAVVIRGENDGEVTETEHEVEKPFIRILSFRNEQHLDGSYQFEYESEDGSKRFEQGYYKDTDKNEEGRSQVMEGTYTYTDPQGEVVKIKYVADENGFRPEGNIIHPSITKYLNHLESNLKNPPQPDNILNIPL